MPPLTYGKSPSSAASSSAFAGARVEGLEQLVEALGDVRAVALGVILDEVLEEVRQRLSAGRLPHLGVVAEQQEQHPGEGHRDLVVALLGVEAWRVALLDRGVHLSHELRCALGLVLSLDVEGATDARQELVDIDD